MLLRPTSAQVESLKYLSSGNSFHINQFLEWLEKSKEELVTLMVNVTTEKDLMFRYAGAIAVLDDLCKEIEKQNK
jgi:hypothetical protein